MITIFTPTYNRKEILNRAYESLKNQTNKNFIWLIIDDGSTDNTEEMIENWKQENKIKITYKKQQNMGKHIAHNNAIKQCKTQYLLCLDSDDYLEENMVEYLYDILKENDMSNIWGIIGPKKEKKAQKNSWVKDVKHSKMAYLYEKYKYKGETYILLNVNLIKDAKYEFPKFGKEKMVPESVLYDRLDTKYDIILCAEPLYIYEYLENGYTKSGIKYLINNKKGMAYANYVRAFESKYSIYRKILSYARYNAMRKIFFEEKFKEYKRKYIIKILGSILSPIFMFNYNLKIRRVENDKEDKRN